MIKNLAQLKRYLRPGREFRCVHNARGPVPDEHQRRIVRRVSTRGCYFEWPDAGHREFYMPFEPAKYYTFYPDAFTITLPPTEQRSRVILCSFRYADKMHTCPNPACPRPIWKCTSQDVCKLGDLALCNDCDTRDIREKLGSPWND